MTDRVKGTKYPLVSYELCPDIAIVDGELCRSMPSHVTANTGLDALTHSLEAYVNFAVHGQYRLRMRCRSY
ncbi:iron-containing alcohol dehydrogenase [Escherichia coli]|uniref:iron-containing alcohol dehydrogenase n=1 Tax=Escherichia coli TaxID=562 RepID=UPI0019D0A5A0|nr:iron-containing alcohol dehydrogenase [Escherichia coli]